MGTDIIEVERIGKAIEKYQKFQSHIYTTREIEYCQKKPNTEEHFAGRFAGKEAVKKAIMSMDTSIQHIPFNSIEILNEENGKPYVSLLKQKYSDYLKKYQLEISISHIKKVATATAIMEKI